MQFENISNIVDIRDNNIWENKIYLTFDIDWINDTIMSYTLDIIEKYDIKATFFVTHNTKLLERMKENPKVELGIHPSFNPLLNGDFKYGKNIDEVVEYYLKIIPDALSVRSHSTTQNSLILDVFAKKGLRYDCNHFIPFNAYIKLNPWLLWNEKLIKIPYFWEDDVHCMYNWEWNTKLFLNREGLKVFAFHPIHVFLNTEKLDTYEKSRKNLQEAKDLTYYINKKNYGTYNFLIDLISS